MGFFLLAFVAQTIQFENMAGNFKAFFGCFLLIGINHWTDVDAFRMATFCTYQMMVMVLCVNKFIDIAGTTEYFMYYIQLGE